MADAQPNLHRRRLGLALRSLRNAAGLSLVEAADRLGLSGAPALSKIENGKQRVPTITLAGFFEAYGLDDARRAAEIRTLASLASSGKRTSLLTQYKDSVRDPFAEYVHMEELARRAESFAHLVPGLLQTEEYAHAVVSGSRKWSTQRDIHKFVELRMMRQRALTTRESPLGLWCVLEEGALRRQVGGPGVMARQLQQLVKLAEELPHVALQVLPFQAGAHSGMDGAFTLLHFETGPPVAVVEPMTTSLYLEEDKDVGRYETGFNHLRAESLNAGRSVSFIRNLIKDP